MVGRAVVKFARGLCLICFCILGVAVVMAFVELVTAPILLKATVCSPTEILPGFNCGNGWVNHLIEIVLDLPFLFFLAVAFSYDRAFFSYHLPLSREFMLLLYLFDVILILALTYLVLRLLERKRARRNLKAAQSIAMSVSGQSGYLPTPRRYPL